MLQYCYQLDYADKFLGLSSAGYTIYTLGPHIDIYLLAERYNIPGLKQLAVEKFETRAAVLSRVEVNKDSKNPMLPYITPVIIFSMSSPRDRSPSQSVACNPGLFQTHCRWPKTIPNIARNPLVRKQPCPEKRLAMIMNT